jgi:hypothetical protein
MEKHMQLCEFAPAVCQIGSANYYYLVTTNGKNLWIRDS